MVGLTQRNITQLGYYCSMFWKLVPSRARFLIAFRNFLYFLLFPGFPRVPRFHSVLTLSVHKYFHLRVNVQLNSFDFYRYKISFEIEAIPNWCHFHWLTKYDIYQDQAWQSLNETLPNQCIVFEWLKYSWHRWGWNNFRQLKPFYIIWCQVVLYFLFSLF